MTNGSGKVPGRFTLPSEKRIKRRRDFLALQKGSGGVSTPHFMLLLGRSPAGTSGESRLGITASKAVGNAVARNRAKRLVREAFRLDPELLPAGLDLVVLVRAGAPGLSLAQVQAEWAKVRGLVQRRARALSRSDGFVRE